MMRCGALPQAAADEFERSFLAALDAILANPTEPAPGHPECDPVNCYTLCKLRYVCGIFQTTNTGRAGADRAEGRGEGRGGQLAISVVWSSDNSDTFLKC